MITDPLSHECRKWPIEQADRWCAAFADEMTCLWEPATRSSRAYVWDLYLDHCLGLGLPPTLTAAAVASFAKACQARGVRGRSFHNYAVALAKVARIVDPASPYITRLEALNQAGATSAAQGSKRKTAVLANAPPADLLFGQLYTGLQRLAVELDGTPRQQLRTAPHRASPERIRLILYRRLLVSALLLACPERRGAFSCLLCSDLAPDLSTITYRACTTKPGTDNVQPVPAVLCSHLRRWLELRALIAVPHDRLWIQIEGDVGAPAGADTIYRDVKAAMKHLTGLAIWPHALRDLAATFARDELHHLPELGSSVLNHQDPRTTRIYTQGAQDSAALQAAQAAIGQAVDAAGKQARAAGHGPSRTALSQPYRPRGTSPPGSDNG